MHVALESTGALQGHRSAKNGSLSLRVEPRLLGVRERCVGAANRLRLALRPGGSLPYSTSINNKLWQASCKGGLQ